MFMRAYAELELFSKPIVQIQYSTRDSKTRPGQTVHVDITNPPIVGDFLIQDLTIDQIQENEQLTPRYTATASSVKFELNDLLLQSLRSIAGGGGSSSGIVATSSALVPTNVVKSIEVKIFLPDLVVPDKIVLIPGLTGKLLILLSLSAWISVDVFGGSNVTASNVRYDTTWTQNLISAFTIIPAGGTTGFLLTWRLPNAFTAVAGIPIPIGKSIVLNTTGTPSATFEGGDYHVLLSYTEYDATI